MKTVYSSDPAYRGYPFCDTRIPLSIEEINPDKFPAETLKRVENAIVFYANYALLMQDFPQLREENLFKKIPELRQLPRPDQIKAVQSLIDQWILKHGAFISEPQAAQAIVNTPIPLGTKTTNGYRPPQYGRALVLSISENLKHLGISPELGESETDQGLLDIKGIGVAPDKTPGIGYHQNGLLALHEALKELLFEQLIYRIFHNEKSSFQTTPVYAIIDPGFEVYLQKSLPDPENPEKENYFLEEGSERPAALFLRRAHKRPAGGGDLPTYGSATQIAKIEMEGLMRKYGITSVNHWTRIYFTPKDDDFEVHYASTVIPINHESTRKSLRNVSRFQGEAIAFDGINIQITQPLDPENRTVTLIDFGHYVVEEDFTLPLLSLVSDRTLRWGGVIWQDDKRFIRPQAGTCIPFEMWENRTKGWGLEEILCPTEEVTFTLCLAGIYAMGHFTPAEVLAYIDRSINLIPLSLPHELAAP